MKHRVLRKSTGRVGVALLAVLATAILVARFGAIASSGASAAGSQKANPIVARAAHRGNPWLNLQDGREDQANYVASTQSQVAAMSQARPLSLASNDLNGDGFPDLACGYATANGGSVVLHFGDPEAFGPTKPETIAGIKNGNFPASFLPDAWVVSVPEAPDYLAVGDFDRDGSLDILTAARGSSEIYFLSEGENGAFGVERRLSLPGVITALATGRDNTSPYADLAVGINSGNGPQVLFYSTTRSVLEETPVSYALPAEAPSIAIGQLDDKVATDLAVAAGNEALVIHGSGERTPTQKSAAAFYQSQIERISFSSPLANVAIGDFVPDWENRMELAVLSSDGTIHIEARGELNTTPMTDEEMFTLRQKIAAMRERGDFGVADTSPWRRDQSESWSEAQRLTVNAPAPEQGFSRPLLVSGNIATALGDELLMVDSSGRQVDVIMNDADAQTGQMKSAQRNAVAIDIEGTPVAALSMRLGVMGQPGVVVLSQGQTAPILLPAAPLVTFAVTKNTDTNDGTCDADCSLREAIVASNANGTGADMITFNAAGNTPTLTIVASDNSAAGGDLDINGNLTVMGNGSGTTILSTSYIAGNNCDCKVFGVNQSGAFLGLAVSFSGVTIQNGFNRTACGTFQETGGGGDFFLTGTGNVYSMTNCVITNNTATNCAASHGGGINVDSANGASVGGPNIGTVTFTGCTVTGNKSDAEGGGLNLAADKHDVNVTNCTIGGALAANGNMATTTLRGNGGGIDIEHSFGGTVTISGTTTIRNNTAARTGGGITITFNPNVSITGATIQDNTANSSGSGSSAGGGVVIAPTGVAMFTPMISLSGCTISSNHSDVGVAAQGGGLYFNSPYSATISNCTISGNTSARGAGVFNGGSSTGATLTINGTGGVTTISNNTATGPGGGVANVDSNGATTILNGTVNAITIDSNTAGSGATGLDQTLEAGGTGSLMTLQGTINLNGGNGIYVGRGTFTSTAGTLNLSGSFTRDSGTTFNNSSGTFNINGAGAQNINGTAVSENFNHFIVNKGGGTLTVGGSTTALTIDGDVTLTAGAFAAGTATTIGMTTGNWTNNGATFTPGSSVVSFTRTTAGQNINGSAATQTFNGITVAKSAQTLAVGGSTTTLTLNGNLLLTSGTFDKGTATALNVGGDWTNNGGTFTNGSAGTVTFNGGGAQGLNGSAATQTFNNFTVNKGGGTLTGGGSTTTLTLTGNMGITAGTFAAGTITTINDPGNWANTGTFAGGSSTVNLTGNNNTQTISGNTTFNNLTSNHTGTGNATATGSTLAVSGLMRVQAGTFISSSTFNNVQIDSGTTLQSDGSQMLVSGSWTNNGGTFMPSGNTVKFNGGGAQAINGTAASQSFSNLEVIKTGGSTLSVGGSTTTLNLDSNLTLTSGIFDKGTANNINVAGSWANSSAANAFTAGAGTVVFNGTSSQTITGSFSTSFNNLTVNNSGIAINMNNDNTVNGILALTTADISVAATKTLTQPNTATSSGTFDVNGRVQRNGFVTAGAALSFGNPNNQITVTSGVAPANIVVDLTRTVPMGAQGLPTAVQRFYTITPSAGGFTGTLRLHYLDSELNGNNELSPNFTLRRFNGTGWAPVVPTSASDTANNWLEKTGVTNFSPWTMSSCCPPTAGNSTISGRITDGNGTPVAGAVVRLSGAQERKFITDANGNYRFENVETNGFYTVTPARANYSFSPASRSFSQLGENTEAAFGATATTSGFVNPLDTPEYFVRQHYLDFLGREPDEAGFNFWSDQILECGGDAGCIERRRINVSAAYFLSIEFQQTGGLIDGLYRAAYGVRPDFAAFMPDTRAVGAGVVVGNPGWEAQLQANKQAFVNSFINRPAFLSVYGNLDNAHFVDTLISHTGVSFGADERAALINGLGDGTQTRADALRSIAENQRFIDAKFNEAFVMMEYFGFLRRDPDESGYQFWLNKLNQFGGNFEQAELVKAFIVSGEFRDRFPR